MRRVIAHVDLDAFFASVELQRRPELRGQPVIVSHSGARSVVTTASYEARRYGVGSAMPTARALRLCPQAIVIAPDFRAYRETSQRVWEIVAEQACEIELVGLDEAYLDLSDLVAPKAFMRRLVADVRAATGMVASVGIGPNKLVAKVASDCEKPSGMVAMSAATARERFAGSPPRLLPGIGPKTAERLRQLGIGTLTALRAADAAMLVSHFGPTQGPYLIRRAHFEDDSQLGRPVKNASRSSETTFETDVTDRELLERTLRRMSCALCERLRRRERVARTIAVKVRLDDFTTVTRSRTLRCATDDEHVVAGVACELLASYGPPRPVRLIGVRIAGFAEADTPAALHGQGQLTLTLRSG